jgi:tetratricopeptide (TPR) repeat protein
MKGLRTAIAVITVTGLLAAVACQPPAERVVAYPEAVRFAAARDSLGLESYLALPAAERQARAAEAATWRQRAVESLVLADELRALRTAVGLDPTAAEAWLQLARRTRWFGDYVQVEDALDGCRQAIVHHVGSRRELAAAAAVCEAWLRYDRGEWKRGLAWTDSAAAHGADDDEVQLLRALHLAGMGRHRRAEDIAYRFAGRDHRAHWIYGVSYWRRGGPEPAHGIFTGTASAVSSGTSDFVKGVMRPTTVHAAECYRDFGTVEELQQNWWLAEQQYEYGAEFVPGIEKAAVTRIDRQPLARVREKDRVPVWIVFDRFYVTGSLSAYVALAFARFEAATEPAAREFWASAVLDGAGTLVRLDVDEAWARRARGLVMAQVPGREGQARVDLESAVRWFDSHRIDDIRSVSTLGHLYLQSNRPARARPLLEQATRMEPENARAWSELGLSYVQLGEIESAMAALQRAIDLDPELAVAWYNRGLLRYHLEDLPGAVADLERAHELAPENPEVEGLLDQLRRRLEES